MIIRGATSGNAVAAARIGPTVAIRLADRFDTARWRLTVEALGPSGLARVGVVDTAVPSVGSGLTRLVAWAHSPGAREWRVSWAQIAGPPNALADLELLASSDGCPNVGVLPNGGFSTVVP